MAFKIEESFVVRAPAERVWRYLSDPRQVVRCLPGAELTEARDERTFVGKVKVKVGPVTAGYSGTATLAEVNDAERRVRITAEGRESGGPGGAKMRLTSAVVAAADGGSQVTVSAEIDLVGRIVQFGRGMIDTANQQLFRQFTECMRATLEAPVSVGASVGTPPPAPADATRVHAAGGAHVAEPVRILPLLFRVFVEWLRRLFRGGASGT